MQPFQFGLANTLLLLAFAAIFIGMLLLALGSISNLGNGSASGGAIILIGPIPIILGGGPNSIYLVAVAALLTVLAIIFFLLMRKR